MYRVARVASRVQYLLNPGLFKIFSTLVSHCTFARVDGYTLHSKAKREKKVSTDHHLNNSVIIQYVKRGWVIFNSTKNKYKVGGYVPH